MKAVKYLLLGIVLFLFYYCSKENEQYSIMEDSKWKLYGFSLIDTPRADIYIKSYNYLLGYPIFNYEINEEQNYLMVGDCNGEIISQYEPLFDSLLFDRDIINHFDFWIRDIKRDFSKSEEYINSKIPNNVRIIVAKHKVFEVRYNKLPMSLDSLVNYVSDPNSEVKRYNGLYTVQSCSEKLTACYYINIME